MTGAKAGHIKGAKPIEGLDKKRNRDVYRGLESIATFARGGEDCSYTLHRNSINEMRITN